MDPARRTAGHSTPTPEGHRAAGAPNPPCAPGLGSTTPACSADAWRRRRTGGEAGTEPRGSVLGGLQPTWLLPMPPPRWEPGHPSHARRLLLHRTVTDHPVPLSSHGSAACSLPAAVVTPMAGALAASGPRPVTTPSPRGRACAPLRCAGRTTSPCKTRTLNESCTVFSTEKSKWRRAPRLRWRLQLMGSWDRGGVSCTSSATAGSSAALWAASSRWAPACRTVG